MMAKVVKKIHLSNFRKFKNKLVEFDEAVCLILAPNASGKTSILEAIQLLASGESFRADKNEEMVMFGEELGRVAGMIETIKTDEVSSDLLAAVDVNKDDDHEVKNEDRLEVMITRGVVQGKRTQSKLFSINQARRRKKDFVGQFGSVAFRPEDMRLIEGAPSRRRAFMNLPLSFIYPEYAIALKNYEQTLIRRNKLLSQIKDGLQNRESLGYWNQSLIKNGRIVQEYRRKLVEFCNQVDFPLPFQLEYDQSLMSTERLEQYATAEVAAGHTLVGPHKDDLQVLFNFKKEENGDGEWHDLATYGSRGQQRMAVLWLKLCELKFIEEKMAQKPVLLLDDILSELDDESKDLVLGLLAKHQTIITSTEARVEKIIRQQAPNLQVIKLTEIEENEKQMKDMKQ